MNKAEWLVVLLVIVWMLLLIDFMKTLKLAGWKWFRSFLPATKLDLAEMEKRMARTQAELAADLDNLTKQSAKIAKEQSDRFDALSTKIQELTDLLNAGGSVSDEVETKLAELKLAQQSLDDAIPDAPVEPPTT